MYSHYVDNVFGSIHRIIKFSRQIFTLYIAHTKKERLNPVANFTSQFPPKYLSLIFLASRYVPRFSDSRNTVYVDLNVMVHAVSGLQLCN